jgi:hypothetical protein
MKLNKFKFERFRYYALEIMGLILIAQGANKTVNYEYPPYSVIYSILNFIIIISLGILCYYLGKRGLK